MLYLSNPDSFLASGVEIAIDVSGYKLTRCVYVEEVSYPSL